MNELSFYVVFTATSLSLYAIAFYLRIKYSGHNYTTPKFWIAVAYTLTLGFFHFRFAETGQIPFVGQMENFVMGYLSMALVLFHVGTLPTPRVRKPWFKRKKFNYTMRR